MTEIAIAAEFSGIESVWAGDSLLARPLFDPLTVLSHIAARTHTTLLGTGVLLAPMRSPVLTARAIATLDQLSGGRLILGVGRGFDLPESRREFAAAGADFDTRTIRLTDTLRLWRDLWSSDGRAVIDRDYATLDEERLQPTPVQPDGPPVWLAGFGPRAFRRVGTLADGWLPYPPSPRDYRTGWDAVQTAADRVGRDPVSITPAVMLTVNIGPRPTSTLELERYVAEFYQYPLELVSDIQACWAGPADDLLGHLHGYWQAGARVLVLRLASLDRPAEQLDAVAQHILPAINAWASADHPAPTPRPRRPTVTTSQPLDLEPIAQRYLAAWEQRDPDAIAALHTDDTRFWAHTGGASVTGRAAVRDAFAQLLDQLPNFGFEVHRVLYGSDFWILDWAVTAEPGGRPIRLDALDVVNVTSDGLVSRKDTFIDTAQMQAAFEEARRGSTPS